MWKRRIYPSGRLTLFQRGRKNKQSRKWLSLDMSQPSEEEGDSLVVKGVSKRIVVVKSPDPKIFEQAIFIIREDYAGQSGMSDSDVYREASRAANRYMGTKCRTATKVAASLRAPLYAAAGAAATGLAWIAIQFTHL
jgi:hypothetical protein